MRKSVLTLISAVTVVAMTASEARGLGDHPRKAALSEASVHTLTNLFNSFKRQNHEFNQTDSATLVLSKSIFADFYKNSKPGLELYIGEKYKKKTYVYASFFLVPHTSFKSQVSMQDGGDIALFVQQGRGWRMIKAEIGWPPCTQRYLQTLVPKKVARAFTSMRCEIPGLVYQTTTTG
jgi:hypothetical protein